MANIARAMREHPSHPGRRLGAMRTGLTIGPPEGIAMSIKALGAAELCNVYGSTETYGNCAVTDAHDPLAAPSTCRVGSAGFSPLVRRSGFIANPCCRFRPRPEMFGSWKLYAR